MILPFLFILFICDEFTLVNKSGHEWVEDDGWTIVRSANSCKYKYKSCLKRFVKKTKKDYNAICE